MITPAIMRFDEGALPKFVQITIVQTIGHEIARRMILFYHCAGREGLNLSGRSDIGFYHRKVHVKFM